MITTLLSRNNPYLKLSAVFFTILISLAARVNATEGSRCFLIDFGSANAQSPGVISKPGDECWNNLTTAQLGAGIPQLIDNKGGASGISLLITDSFWQESSPGICNHNGTTASKLYPATATEDSFFIGPHRGIPDNTAKVQFSGLSDNAVYKLRVYASRMTDDLESDRTTIYTINSVSKKLQVRNNIDDVVEFIDIVPHGGRFELGVSLDANSIYGYLGVLELIEDIPPTVSIVKPASSGITTALLGAARSEITYTQPANILIEANASDLDGKIVDVKYYANNVLIGTSTSAPYSFVWKNVPVGSYSLTAKATDDEGVSSTSSPVLVKVIPKPNTPPTANAGSDKEITLPISEVTLSGSGIDSDGSISKYQWTKVSGGGANIISPAAASTSVTGFGVGSYTFRLTVTDNQGAIASDDVVVTVHPKPNTAPFASAGADQVITLPVSSVSVVGSGKDADGIIVKYSWAKISGGVANITNPNAASTSITGLTVGTYVFRLTVTDNQGATASDDLNIKVNPKPNVAPTSNAGSDQTITAPVSTVLVNGSGKDSDGSIVKYSWTKISGGSATITSPGSAITSITGLGVGSYTFRLTVTDNQGATASDDAMITVKPKPNTPPTAKAGPDQQIVQPASSVTLNGSGIDPDGSIVKYSWTKVSGGTAIIQNPSSPSTAVTGLIVGSYVFRITVTDNQGASAADDVSITVSSATLSKATETIHLAGTVPGTKWGYVEYLPEGYDQKSNWPIVIFLHGMGSMGDGTKLSSLKSVGGSGFIRETRMGAKFPMVILQPQTPTWWNYISVEEFRAFAFNKYKINPKRFYITGLSMGGGGVCDYLDHYADKVAAALPLSPAGSVWNPDFVVKSKVAIWCAHAFNDSQVDPASSSVRSFNRLGTSMGASSPFVIPELDPLHPAFPAYTAKTAYFDSKSKSWVWVDGQVSKTGVLPIFCTYYSNGDKPGTKNHGGWTRMYSDPKVAAWMLQQSR